MSGHPGISSTVSGVRNGADWRTEPPIALEHAIVRFKQALPGWWYSVCECQVSCDASCAPTTDSPDIALIDLDAAFDSGFHADLRQPTTLAEALRDVMAQALEAKARVSRPLRIPVEFDEATLPDTSERSMHPREAS